MAAKTRDSMTVATAKDRDILGKKCDGRSVGRERQKRVIYQKRKDKMKGSIDEVKQYPAYCV